MATFPVSITAKYINSALSLVHIVLILLFSYFLVTLLRVLRAMKRGNSLVSLL